MAFQYEGIPGLAALDDNDWHESRDAVRLALQRIDRALKQLYVGSNPLGSGDPVPQNIGGIGGDTVSINQVNENEPIKGDTDGILHFGRGETDSLAHAIRVSTEGEVLIAELPGVTLKAAFSNSQAYPDFVTFIGTLLYGKREAGGTDPGNMGRLGAGDFPGGDIETDGDDDDVGLLVMPSPKQNSRTFNEFNGKWYTGGGGIGVNKVMSSGTASAGSKLNVHRYSRGSMTFTVGVGGTPTGHFRIYLYAHGTAAAPAIYQKHWEFNPESFVDGITNSHYLEFDLTTKYISIQMLAAGTTSVNYYEIANFYLNFTSGT